MVTQTIEEEYVFLKAPVQGSESTDVSNVDVGQVDDIGNGITRLAYGPIESVLVRGRGNNQQGQFSTQSIGRTLTSTAPPWPNANGPADLPARHGSAERETQQTNAANQSTAEDEMRPLRRSDNRTRSQARQPTYAPTTFSESPHGARDVTW